ncbi:MAG: hypothetical protein QGH32_05635 [Alphaproteobacteria bacterium]|jgi:hypothetical protein|nr:hypothetical protein [Alphaproteobacteria bacterium]
MIENSELNWPRDTAGYDIEEAPNARSEIKMLRRGMYMDGDICIVPRGGRIDDYDPLKIDGLYRQLAESDLTPEGALQFVSTFGIPIRSAIEDRRYPLHDFLEAVFLMRLVLSHASAEVWGEFARVVTGAVDSRFRGGRIEAHIALRARNDGERPDVVLHPNDLWSAIWLQLATDITAGANLRSCAQCGIWFKYGPGTGRRSTAVYCSPKCQSADAYAKRKAAAK